MSGSNSLHITPSRVLVIRLSSIGDIIQAMSVVEGIRHTLPMSEIHWLVRADMARILAVDTQIDHVHSFDRRAGLWGLVRLAWRLRSLRFDFVYDAHQNIRSWVVRHVLLLPFQRLLVGRPRLVVRGKQRLRRWLYFGLGVRRALPMPFRAIASFRRPLQRVGFQFPTVAPDKWRFPDAVARSVDALMAEWPHRRAQWVCLVPSAAHEMKRWPVEYFQELVRTMPNQPFVVIGGPADTFCADIAAVAPERVLNLAGRTSLDESFALVARAPYVVSGDTGFLHAADLFRRPGMALMGPSAFGYPTNDSLEVAQANLPCIPCSKDGSGRCSQQVYKRCLYELRPRRVAQSIREHFAATHV